MVRGEVNTKSTCQRAIYQWVEDVEPRSPVSARFADRRRGPLFLLVTFRVGTPVLSQVVDGFIE